MSDRLHVWLSEPLDTQIQAGIDRLHQIDDVARVAVMPDVHLSSPFCVGMVVGTRTLLLPDAIGSDIGCGMTAIRCNGGGSIIRSQRSADELVKKLGVSIPIIRHRKTSLPNLPAELEAMPLSSDSLGRHRQRDGIYQFGTLGRGNHFVEMQSDSPGNLWVMVHSGSRGMGNHIRAAHARSGIQASTGPTAIEADSPSGKAFLQDMAWAVVYARMNREAILKAACNALSELFSLSPVPESTVDCSHNYVRQETHFGESLWVHRKGAISAKPGEPGIIPGSMGTHSYLVTGRGCPESLMSSSHGAGRRMSRTDARHRISDKAFRRSMSGVWWDTGGLRRLLEEAPDAYKDINAVMRAQGDLTKIHVQLRPVLSFKG